MFISAICVLFLIKLRWPKKKSIYNVTYCCLAMPGLQEHFRDKCGGTPQWLDKNTYYIAFQEGWALYAENPILSDDVNLYKDNILQLFGMYKWQVTKIA